MRSDFEKIFKSDYSLKQRAKLRKKKAGQSHNDCSMFSAFMAKIERDPRTDPRTGDIIARVSTTSGNTLRRIVVMRDGMQVFYKTSEDGDVLKCWVMTWREWAIDSEVESNDQ